MNMLMSHMPSSNEIDNGILKGALKGAFLDTLIIKE